MPSVAILGSQWGDEGKGKIVDIFVSQGDIIARYQGGNNAGHTIIVDGEKFILHLLPSGIITEGKVSILGNGMVINLDAFFKEIEALNKKLTENSVFISSKAHISLPLFQHIDAAFERLVSHDNIGTTKKGIGPTYAFKALRKGIRICDIFLEDKILKDKLESLLSIAQMILTHYNYSYDINIDSLFSYIDNYRNKIRPYVIDTSEYLIKAHKNNKRIIIEGSQGCLLDIDHGTYPFVTSSSCIAGGISAGLGIPPKMINIVLGVTKAYATRVGNGPFPTELNDDNGIFLRNKGGEYGATTNRPRRCGWLDMVLLNYSCHINGYDCLALTKSDVLTGLQKIPVCIGYKYKDTIIKDDFIIEKISQEVQPVYKELKGWKEDISYIQDYDDLPKELKDYIKFIEDFLEIPIIMVSTGPQRKQTIIRESSLFDPFD